MNKKYRKFLILTTIVFLAAFFASCGKTSSFESSDIDKKVADEEEQFLQSHGEETFAKEESRVMELSEMIEDLESFIYLKDGDIQHLIEYSFGDAFDYGKFTIRANFYGSYMYERTDSEYDYLLYLFDGQGMRFSGLAAYWTGCFFGIQLGEDNLEKLVPVLGEPDTYQTRDDWEGVFAIYNFEKATLAVRIMDGKIEAIEYTANEDAINNDTVSDVQTDFERDYLEGCDYAETIYKWEALYHSSANQTEACYHPYDDDYDESKTDIFVENYLREQEIYQKTPDGVTYNQEGYPFIEYYVDEEQHKYCFVIHLWGDYWIDYEAGTSKYADAIYCTTHILEETDKVGNLIYHFNEAENITREQLYDELGKRMSDITYEYIPRISFPFITQYWNLNTSYEQIDTALCRNQKTWFYKEQTQFDETGNIIGYQGFSNQQDGKEYISFPSTCVYDTAGRLEAIREELLEDNAEKEEALGEETGESLGEMEFHYNENGMIEAVDYFRPPGEYGTTDSSGTILYDDKGRMIYNEYYITHGSHINGYLYEEDTQRPWACFYWCSFAPGFEKIYLYQPVNP